MNPKQTILVDSGQLTVLIHMSVNETDCTVHTITSVLLHRISSTLAFRHYDYWDCKCLQEGELCQMRQKWTRSKGGCEAVFLRKFFMDGFLVDKTTCACTQRLPVSECHLPHALCTVDFIRIVAVCINVFFLV